MKHQIRTWLKTATASNIIHTIFNATREERDPGCVIKISLYPCTLLWAHGDPYHRISPASLSQFFPLTPVTARANVATIKQGSESKLVGEATSLFMTRKKHRTNGKKMDNRSTRVRKCYVCSYCVRKCFVSVNTVCLMFINTLCVRFVSVDTAPILCL